MGAQPEPKPDHQPIAWISRDVTTPEPAITGPGPRPGIGDRLRGAPPGIWIAILAALALAIGAALWYSRASGPAAPGAAAGTETTVPLVTVTSPGLSAVASKVSFTGTIAARHDMPIGVEGEGGRISAIHVEIGDRVRKGQLLAQLDDSVLRPQVNRLAASLEEARAQAALSQAEYRRVQSLEASGALSVEEIERRRAAAVTDEARVKVAAAQLAEARARMQRTEIRAPVDGIVLTRDAEVGQTASPGGPALFRLASQGEVEMRGQVAERDLPHLKIGQPASVYLTGVAAPFKGEVRLLGAVIDPSTRLGEIRVALESNPTLRPGAFARGEVIVDRAERPVLPQTAVLSDDAGSFVYIVNGENEVERRAVRVADITPEGIVIADGLNGDERVISTAGAFLREGERVEIAGDDAERS